MPASRSVAPLLLRQRVAALRRTLGGVQQGDVRAIHQARVATRRLREALPLIPGGKPGRRLQRASRDLTQGLGPVRELDVALLMLDELEGHAGVPHPAVVCLRRAVRDERRVLHRELVRQLRAVDFERLQRKTLRALERHADDRPTAADRQAQVAAARRRAARRAERLEATIDIAGSIYLSERLHDVRIAVKKLRYALEIVRNLSASHAEARIRTLKRTQDLLGRMHDLEVLIARTRALQAATVRDLQLSSDLDQFVRHLETECRQIHGHYITTRRGLLEICNRVIAAVEPREAA
jgi:CHAD domain-containing protein